MFEIDNKHYHALMQNPDFTYMHNPQFIKDLSRTYRNNIHLSPFFVNIKAYADNLDEPKIIIIKKGDNLFMSANAECDTYDESLREFITDCFAEGKETIWLNVPTEKLEAKINSLFSEYKPQRAIRYNFRLNKEFFYKLPKWHTQIPPDFSIEYYDAQSVDFLNKHNRLYECWFPESNRFAFAALFQDKLISECFSVFVDDGMVEVGIETDEHFRRRGFAFLTSAAFLEHCLNNNLEPNWGCWHWNQDSTALAKKLGFELFEESTCVLLFRAYP